LSKDVEVSVIRVDLVEDALGFVPLIEHGLDPILFLAQPKSRRAFVGLSRRVALHDQLHPPYYDPRYYDPRL
jgi:hypothetical protein